MTALTRYAIAPKLLSGMQPDPNGPYVLFTEAERDKAEAVREAREIITNFKAMVKQVPEFNHMKYDSFGRRVNKFLDDTALAARGAE